ncbi:MAG: precorrin-8X methylmutase [Rhodospirillaceae bacterium]|nr:precorrin-8X methylmutase [Alphaproteobacteria bacterium]MBR72919.1 precorrin-8X methylmutase [Rhodospirillaceae bacterium]|tara:strand:- start:7278 stop:7907 length:630 start_codon:yes stop_codon:yes gene_type:complete
MKINYLKNPKEIIRKSFEIIKAETNIDELPLEIQIVAQRIIHTCGIPEITDFLFFSKGAVESGKKALETGMPLLVDVNMVAAGINTSDLSPNNKIICTINDQRVIEIAKQLKTTRSAAALELWKPVVGGAVIAIGNAPTALFHLLEMLSSGADKPSLIIATPPGFVGAEESKDLLINNNLSIPYIVIKGRMGGSALAAAIVNALTGESK